MADRAELEVATTAYAVGTVAEYAIEAGADTPGDAFALVTGITVAGNDVSRPAAAIAIILSNVPARMVDDAAEVITKEAGAVSKAVTKGEATVIGRVKDLQKLSKNEKSLLDRFPDKGSPQTNWKQNSGVLRQEMGKGQPIRDASPGDITGQFLNAERNLLESHGWTFDKSTNSWNPPK